MILRAFLLLILGAITARAQMVYPMLRTEPSTDTSAVSPSLPNPPVENPQWVDSSITIDELSLDGVDLRATLLALAKVHKVNLYIEPDVKATVSLNLRNIRFTDLLEFLKTRYGIRLWKEGDIVTVSAPVASKSESFTLRLQGDSVWIDAKQSPLGDLVRSLTTESSFNFLVSPRDSNATVTGLVQGVSLPEGLEPLLAVNDLQLERQGDAYIISRVPEQQRGASIRRPVVAFNDSGFSLTVTNEPLARIIPAILDQAQVNWSVYGDLPGSATATIQGLTLDETLRRLLMGTDYSFAVKDDGYFIGPKSLEGVVVSRLLPLSNLVVADIQEKLPANLVKPLEIKIVPEQNAIMALGPFGAVSDFAAYIDEVDRPVAQVLIEVLAVDYSRDFLREWKVTVDASGGASETNPYDFLYPQINSGATGSEINKFIENNFAVDVIHGLPPQWYFKLQALESEGKLKIQSRPSIATLSGHEASINVGTTQYYILETETTYGGDVGSPTTRISKQFQTIEASLNVRVKPWVTGNGEIVVEVDPEFKTPKGEFDPDIPPTIDQRSLKSTVTLRDGQTIVLGGLRQETEQKAVSKFPFLGDIPVLGLLFRNTRTEKSVSELMIYITPKVYYGSEADVKVPKGL